MIFRRRSLTLHGYQYEPPAYTDAKRTRFLDAFCETHNIEVYRSLQSTRQFTLYSVRYEGSGLNTLIHYHGQAEEAIVVQNDYDMLARKLV